MPDWNSPPPLSNFLLYVVVVVVVVVVCFFIFPRWSTTDVDIKVRSVENPELTDTLLLKTGVSHNITMHASFTARNFFLDQKCLPSRSIHRHFLFSPRAISAGMTVSFWRSPSPPPRFLLTVVVVFFLIFFLISCVCSFFLSPFFSSSWLRFLNVLLSSRNVATVDMCVGHCANIVTV